MTGRVVGSKSRSRWNCASKSLFAGVAEDKMATSIGGAIGGPLGDPILNEVKPAYLLSLPERVVRSLAAVPGGLLRGIREGAPPARLRRTTLYRTMVDVALRFMIEEVGEVQGIYPSEGKLAEAFLLQRGASHGVELLGILAFHASPVWVLAALADAAGGSRTLMREITTALQDEGLLDSNAGFDTVEQVLDGLEKTSDHLATTLNLPPVNVPALRQEWVQLKEELRAIP